MSNFLTVKETAQLTGHSERHVCRLCDSGNFPGAKKSKAGWKISMAAVAKFLGKSFDVSISPGVLTLSQKELEKIQRKIGLLAQLEIYITKIESCGGNRTEAVRGFANRHKINLTTLYRWRKAYRKRGEIGLVDTRGGDRQEKESISPEAFEYFKSFYLSEEQLSAKLCWQIVNRLNHEENHGWTVPALRTIYRLIDRDIPYPALVLFREGQAAYTAKCAPYIQNDPESVGPGEIWIGDHHKFNCWVRYRNRWVRPWITAWEDKRSRTIVGWDVNAGPNQTTILLATKKGIDSYGPPGAVKIDNGRDYDSELWTGTTKKKRKASKKGYLDETLVAGLYAMLNITVSFAIPYRPQSKPVERFFDTLDRQFTKTLSTYCGKNSTRKPEALTAYLNSEKAISEAHDIESFAALVCEYINMVYNRQAHSGAGMTGKSPLEVMATRTSKRVVSEDALTLLSRVWSGTLIVGKNGVRFKDLWYGQYNNKLLLRQGEQVRVAYDPDDLRRVWVYDAATMRLITIAEQNRLVAYGHAVAEDDLREGMKQQGRAKKVVKSWRNAALTKNMDTASLAIRAQQERTRPEPKPQKRAASLKPVKTVFDGQEERHKQEEQKLNIRKAAGDELRRDSLEMDLSELGSQKYKQLPKVDIDFSLLNFGRDEF